MEEAYKQFRNHRQKYSLTNGQSLKLARKRLKLTIKIENFALSKIPNERITISFKSILWHNLVKKKFDLCYELEHVFDSCTTEQTLKLEIKSLL